MFIFIILFLALIIAGISYEQEYIEQPLKLENTIALRGICAIEIMLGHIGIATDSPFLYINRKAGILVVGIFFLLSGYGLMYSVQNKKNYLRGFLHKRIFKIFYPSLIIYIIYIIIDIFRPNFDFSITSIFQYIFLYNFPQKINWYVTEILALYLLFYILYHNMKVKYATIFLILFCVLFIIFANIIDMSNPWYGSTLCFPLGVLLAQNESNIKNTLKKKFFLITASSLCLTMVGTFLFFFFSNYSFISDVIGRNIASVSFCIFIYMLLMKFRIGNKVSQFLGSISYEIFLIHGLFIYHNYHPNTVLNTFISISLSIGFALILNKINKLFSHIFYKLLG